MLELKSGTFFFFPFFYQYVHSLHTYASRSSACSVVAQDLLLHLEGLKLQAETLMYFVHVIS